MCSVQSVSYILSELDETAVVAIGHPEATLLVTGNSITTVELARDRVNKGVVRAEDLQTVATTALTDYNVACSIDGNACRSAEGPCSIAGDLFPLWREYFDAVRTIGSNVKTTLMVKSHSPRILLARERVRKAAVSIEHIDKLFATISHVDLPIWVSADTARVGQLSLSTGAKI